MKSPVTIGSFDLSIRHNLIIMGEGMQNVSTRVE